MNKDFFKFPSTPHLMILENISVRDDKIFSNLEQKAFLKQFLVVEEKVDGANLGISFDINGNICVQNRGSYLNQPFLNQWKKLDEWLSIKLNTLFDCLNYQYILFGEWCFAQHTIYYTQLPDWFLGFDIYDKKNNCFLSSEKRNILLEKMNIFFVPKIAEGYFKLPDLIKLISRSKLGNESIEGLYLRYESEEKLIQRAKLIRPNFIQAINTHWSHNRIHPNQLIK